MIHDTIDWAAIPETKRMLKLISIPEGDGVLELPFAVPEHVSTVGIPVVQPQYALWGDSPEKISYLVMLWRRDRASHIQPDGSFSKPIDCWRRIS